MNPSVLGGFGPAANSLGFAGLSLVVILGLAFAVRTLWRSLQEEQAKAAKRDALILDMETEHQRLLVRFEEAMVRLREVDARCREAEAKRSVAEAQLRQAQEELDRRPARRTR